MNLSMSAAAEFAKGQLVGEDRNFSGVSIDSRKIDENELFLALKGPNHDAHDYVEQALENNATGLIVERDLGVNKPQVIVENTRIALGQIAAGWRKQLENTQIIAVTGSNGKTTVKEMLLAILSKAGNTIATEGNLNNDIGMPMTLLKVDKVHEYAVIEMGANHAGEIDYLSSIAAPHVALVNNAGPAHLEGFGSLQGVARAKGEIYQHLTAKGVAVINGDDHFADYWLQLNTGRSVLTFSLSNKDADVYGLSNVNTFTVVYKNQQVQIDLPLLGEHNQRNALAAITIALSLNISFDIVKAGLESMGSVSGRLKVTELQQSNLVIDDSYNANLASFKAGIDVMTSYQKKTCLLMGDMAELGQYSEEQHAQVGRYAKDLGVDVLMACGLYGQKAVEVFGSNAHHFYDQLSMASFIENQNYKNTVFLVKGSRSAKMENIVEALKNHFGSAGN